MHSTIRTVHGVRTAAARPLALLAACALSAGCATQRGGAAPGREPGADCGEAQVVLRRFLDLDAAAGREWTPELTALITDTDGPGWDRQTVVSSYRIEGCSGTGAVELPVRYELLGQLGSEPGSGAVRFQRAPAGASERRVFRVVRTRDGLRVEGVGAIEPHVGKSRAIAQVEGLLKQGDSGPAGANTAAQGVLATLRGLP